MIFTFILSGVGLIFVLLVLYKAVSFFLIQQEIQKARLLAHTLVYTRDYLATLAPYVKLTNKHFHPFSITPAYTVSKISTIIATKEHMYVKQTSDKYRDIKNKPNQEELKAIEFFKKHKNKEELHYLNSEHSEYIFYAYPLKIEKSCLKCHGLVKNIPKDLYKKLVKYYGNRAFGYKPEEIRGIIAIRIPFEIVRKEIDNLFHKIAFVILIIYILGVILFLKINSLILRDINEINSFLENNLVKGIYKPFRKKLFFRDFDLLKRALNNTVQTFKKFKKEIYNNFYYDFLTNLPNRKKLNDLLNKKDFIIALFDIDDFREINYYYGEELADLLIKKVAKRFGKFRVFHIKIDEFAVILEYKDSENEIRNEVKKILNELEKPYVIDDFVIYVKFRAGVAYEQKDLMSAIMALDVTKMLKKDIVFDGEAKEFRKKFKTHLQYLQKLKIAIEKDKIVPYFQPIVDQEKRVCKYEALVRLIDEEGNVVSPFFFLDVAKKSRLYYELTKIMIDKTFNKFKNTDINFSINLTTLDLENDFTREYIIEKIRKFKNGERIGFEIVESEDIRNSQKALEFIKTVKSFGCKILIDDFGSGYANFDYLLSLGADGIKIDGSLIKNILKDENSQIIVKTIVSFAKEVNMQVIAEFVENNEIFEYLKSLEIDCYQGYFFSPPKDNI